MNNVSGSWSQPTAVYDGFVTDFNTFLDKGDHLHIVFDGTRDILVSRRTYYMNDISGAFSIPVAVSLPEHKDPVGSKIAVDSHGNAHIVYDAPWLAALKPELHYVNNVSGRFGTPVPIGDPDGLNYPVHFHNLAIDRSDVIHLAYKTLPGQDGILFYGTNASGAFVFNSSCYSMSNYWFKGVRFFALGPDATPHFAFFDWVGNLYESDTEIYYLTLRNPPAVTTESADGITQTLALLHATVNPRGQSTSAYFNYGKTTSYGSKTNEMVIGAQTSGQLFSQQLSNLVCGQTYHFQAVARNADGTTPGADRQFTTSNCTAIPAEMTAPTPGSTLTAATVTFGWNAGIGVSEYWLNVGRTIGVWDIFNSTDSEHALSKTVTGLPTDGSRIFARLWSKIGADWLFNDYTYVSCTNCGSGVPGSATLLSPAGSVSTQTPTYVWNAVSNATWYYLWVNDSASAPKHAVWYTSVQAGCAAGTGTCSVTPAAPLAAGSAQWWIQTWNEYGYGPWSQGKIFSVGAGDLPGVATLISPSGTIHSTQPAYTWNAVPTATWYYLWINDSGAAPRVAVWFTAAEVSCPSGNGTCSVIPNVPIATGAAKWWIQAWNPNGYGPWSAGMDFLVSGP